MSVGAREYERLLQFVYLCPVGIVRFARDGAIDLINPVATSLLAPLADGDGLANLFALLRPIAPSLCARIEAFEGLGTLCDQERITWRVADREVVVALTAMRIDAEVFVASLIDVTQVARNERRLAELARLDELTGALNRRAFHERLAHEVQRAERYGDRLALVLFDLDHFKQINDTYGHDAGDAVLRSVAKIAGASIRTVDAFARLGGEEFAVLLPATDRAGAAVVAERLRTNLAATPIVHGEHVLRVTGSFGCAHFGSTTSSGDRLLTAADGALYAAKRGGRNRVVEATSESVRES